jgi:poly-gamma-glutamate capsule biosynthesis protein CapA/YwtB (metallophosphatase superfamily)
MKISLTEKGACSIKRMLAPFSAVFLLFLLVSCQPEASRVTLALLGDLMIGRAVDPTPDSLSYLDPELKAADLRLANLESPLAQYMPSPSDTSAGYNLCTSATRAGLLSAWGLDLLSISNNHRFDCGPDGPMETARILNAAGLHPVGPGLEPLYREINGLRLGFLAFDDILAPIDISTATQAIQSARAGGRLVIVSIHWGAEYQQGPNERQKTLARQFADAGATLVVGTHPHVLQPAEWIRTSKGKTLVIYSLGNVLFDQRGLADTRQSALMAVTLDSRGVAYARAVPFEIDISRNRVILPDGETAQQIINRFDLP